MPFEPYNRDVYLGEPVDNLEVHQGDTFYLGLDLYDDQGVAWTDGWICHIYTFMSRQDSYAGSGTYLQHFSGSSSGGSASVLITSSGTAVPGLYQAEIVLVSGSVEITAAVFEFLIIGD